MAQMSLFSRVEIAKMRDRTAGRNYSAERDAFRREHEKHRAWGLQQRHAAKLRRLQRDRSVSLAGPAKREDHTRAAMPVRRPPARPTEPPQAPSAQTPSAQAPSAQAPAAQAPAAQAPAAQAERASVTKPAARPAATPHTPPPAAASGRGLWVSRPRCPASPRRATLQTVARTSTPRSSPRRSALQRVPVGGSRIFSGYCGILVAVTLDAVRWRGVCDGHHVMAGLDNTNNLMGLLLVLPAP